MEIAATSPPHLPLRPRLIDRACAALYDSFNGRVERDLLSGLRRDLLARARGRVAELGAGTGANLPHYPAGQVSEVVLVDPGIGMLARALEVQAAPGLTVSVEPCSAERLPFPSASFDTAVFTLCLCTIRDAAAALAEAGRVLRPGGRLLILEHVRADDPGLARWQDRLAPVQRLVAGGCNPNRDTGRLVVDAGFEFEWVERRLELRMPTAIVRPLLIGSALHA